MTKQRSSMTAVKRPAVESAVRSAFALTVVSALLAANANGQEVRVWAAESVVANSPSGVVVVPPGSKLLSGGARANWSHGGSLLTRLQPAGPGPNQWAASAKDHQVADPASLTVYGIALSDPQNAWEVMVWQATSPVGAHPMTRSSVPAGYAMTGGGCVVNWNANPDAAGNLLTASYPDTSSTWECRGKDHGIASPASITSYAIGIRPKEPGAPLPIVQISSVRSAVEAHPSAMAPALPGFVVTGGGARALTAQPDGAGQLLTASFPELAAGSSIPSGWRAASKDHVYASPGTVEVFAVNVRFAASPGAVTTGGLDIPGGVTLSAPFAIRATAVSPFVTDLAWNAVPAETGYSVERDGAALAQLPAGTRTFRDITVTPGSRHTYRVVAMIASAFRPGTGVPPAPSAVVEVVTPGIHAPGGLTVAGTSTRSVDVTWQPVAGAANYVIDRNGSTWRAGPQAAAGHFVDTNLPVDVVTYRMRSLYARPDGGEVLSDATQPVTLRLGPLRALAVGDSIMWGQGLRESSKFTRKVEQWLSAQLNRPVSMTVLARSGAIIGEEDDSRTDAGPAYGEVPSDFPLIKRQALDLGLPAADDVDLVLVDGCINDVGIPNLLDVTLSDQAISSMTSSECGKMRWLLREIAKKYAHSKIIVTGYFQIATANSDLKELAALTAHIGATLFPAIAPLVPILPPDPFWGAIAGAITAEEAKKKWISHSITFHALSTAELQLAVAFADQAAGGGRIRFAPVPFGPNNGFAGSDSWLYSVPLTEDRHDEVYAEREQTCAAIADQFKRAKCTLASMGHPNPRGAQAYADAIIAQMASFIPAWRGAFASPQRVP